MTALPAPEPWLEAFLSGEGVDAGRWLLGSVRVLPTALLVATALPVAVSMRLALSLALGLAVAPSLAELPSFGHVLPVALLSHLLLGLPVALSVALVFWAANMVGGFTEQLAGLRLGAEPSQPAGLGLLLSLLVALGFLASGGPVRLVEALSGTLALAPLSGLVELLLTAVELTVAISAPLAVAAILVELFSALTLRACVPEQASAVSAIVRSFLLLGMFALLAERMLALVLTLLP